YRLRVEDIVYEPVDKEGLTQLIKRGVLLGAGEIAEADGEWMPITEHPVFQELRRKMAREAHDLLAQYGDPSKTDQKKPDEATPETVRPEPQQPEPQQPEPQQPEPQQPEPQQPEPQQPEPQPARTDSPGEANLQADGGAASKTEAAPSAANAPREPSADDIDYAGIPTIDAELEEDGDEPAVSESPRPSPSPERDEGEFEVPAEPVDSEPPSDAKEEWEIRETEIDERPPKRTQSKSKLRTWIPIGAAVFTLGVVAAFALSPVGSSYVDDALDRLGGGEETDDEGDDEKRAERERTKQVDEALSEASSSLAKAADVDPGDPDLQQRVADQLLEDGRVGRAAPILFARWQNERDDLELAAQTADALVESERYADARTVARYGLAAESESQSFEELYERAVVDDPALSDEAMVDIEPGEHADTLSPASEADRLNVRLALEGEDRFFFKPAQSDWKRGWRKTVASWRLCEMLGCNFLVPEARPARLTREDFDSMASDLSDEERAEFEDLHWVEEDDQTVVYGALQDTVDAPARFPIESVQLWRPWLLNRTPAELEDTALDEALSPIGDISEKMYERALAEFDEETNASVVAGDVAGILLFDFLTNNWDRFTDDRKDWGDRVRIREGNLVSLRNEGAFQPRASTRIEGRFEWSERFSRQMVAALEVLSREMAYEQLFPEPTRAEESRLDVMWDQRSRALQRVDRLVDSHGSETILAFP
ncbi:MAG: hypothetical protein ACOCV2_00620, partial [Persicimonas sp.]